MIMEISKEGFKTVKGIDGSIRLLFDSSRSVECCKYAIEHGIKIISIYPGIYLAKDLKPIMPLSNYIEGLMLEEGLNYKGLEQFVNLTFLSVPDNRKDIIHLSAYLNLKVLSCSFTERLRDLESCTKLRSLTVGNYKSITRDLSILPPLNSLVHLSLIKPDIVTLHNIENFNILKKLEIFDAPQLKTITALKALSNSLEEIEIGKCKKIDDYEVLGEIKSLKKIILSESGAIKSLDFVKKLPHLKFISFWGTNVLDGNIKYCEGIDYVGFDNKKHYTHKSESFGKNNKSINK